MWGTDIVGSDNHHLLYLSLADVKATGVTMPTVIDALENMLRQKGNGQVEMPAKLSIHPGRDAFINAMPAYIPAMKSAGIKWVSGFPKNPELGLSYINGLIILNDTNTGIPLAVMDCTWVTGMRAGATTAVAAKCLARKSSSTVGILACGVQGRRNLQALACVFDLKSVKAYDTNAAAARRYADEMSEQLGVVVDVVDTPRQAVERQDLIVTSGPIQMRPTPVISPGWFAEGAFACAMDYDSYWQGAALREMDKLATDDLQQMEHARQAGYFQQTPTPYADLGQIVAGRKPGRESDSERTISINLGTALADMAVAPLVYQAATAKGIGVKLTL